MIEFAYNNGKRRTMNRVYGDILAKLGQGKVIEPEEGRYRTEVLTAEDNTEISPRTGKPKRQYKRRDLRAEQ